MHCQEARRLLHDRLDDAIDQEAREQLEQHLLGCSDCRSAEQSLRWTVDRLEVFTRVKAPQGFTDQVISSLPRTGGRLTSRVLSLAAALVLLLASPIYFSNILSHPQVICSDHQASIIQTEGGFVVPKDQIVRGNITVYRSNLLVKGQVFGDVQVVDGQLQLEAASQVTGQISERPSSGSLRLKLAFAELWEDIGSWLFFR